MTAYDWVGVYLFVVALIMFFAQPVVAFLDSKTSPGSEPGEGRRAAGTPPSAAQPTTGDLR